MFTIYQWLQKAKYVISKITLDVTHAASEVIIQISNEYKIRAFSDWIIVEK